jgi:microcin C transport system ATP-binding protein
LPIPGTPYTRRLIDSRPERDVPPSFPDAVGHEPLMRAQALRVTYPVPLGGVRGWFAKGEFVAVRGADFVIPPGQTLGVIGESGSGKSTLALAALGLLPFSGALQVASGSWHQGAKANKALRQSVQVVFQDPFSSLSPRMTIEEIVGEGLRVHAPGLSTAQRQARVLTALEEGRFGEGPVSWAAGALPSRVLRRTAPAHCHRASVDRRAEIAGPR